ncbi:hypothetical protein HMH01_08220 [Halovulum dunhuangense]|uniref:Uncharacterized protein n=1 Tax=Halovulum dunhuangense TaxID=1505036 RepID=A0A849L2B9_9RHOB|nr:hypothetical protein [Halovulum dunhuangense]NNU80425.1 hypothetical protein [Halovulum dunhuangense]
MTSLSPTRGRSTGGRALGLSVDPADAMLATAGMLSLAVGARVETRAAICVVPGRKPGGLPTYLTEAQT